MPVSTANKWHNRLHIFAYKQVGKKGNFFASNAAYQLQIYRDTGITFSWMLCSSSKYARTLWSAARGQYLDLTPAGLKNQTIIHITINRQHNCIVRQPVGALHKDNVQIPRNAMHQQPGIVKVYHPKWWQQWHQPGNSSMLTIAALCCGYQGNCTSVEESGKSLTSPAQVSDACGAIWSQ